MSKETPRQLAFRLWQASTAVIKDTADAEGFEPLLYWISIMIRKRRFTMHNLAEIVQVCHHSGIDFAGLPQQILDAVEQAGLTSDEVLSLLRKNAKQAKQAKQEK